MNAIHVFLLFEGQSIAELLDTNGRTVYRFYCSLQFLHAFFGSFCTILVCFGCV